MLSRAQKIFYITLLVISLLVQGCASNKSVNTDNSVAKKLAESLAKKRVLLPNGWSLSSAGTSVRLGDLPLNLAISRKKGLLAVTNNGYSKQSIMLIDARNNTMLDSVAIHRSWVGLKFSSDGNYLYASGGNDNDVVIYNVENDKLHRDGDIALGKPWPKNRISVAGLTVDSQNHYLYVVTKDDSALYICDVAQRKVVKRIPLPCEAYTCLLSPDGSRLYISLWGGEKVAVYNTQTMTITGDIKVESHPNDMAITANGKTLFVANANSNSVSVIDTKSGKVLENINAALYPDSPTGSTTTGVALADNDTKLYIANADNNCLAVFNVSSPGNSHSLGFIPVGWYPTAVRVFDNKIFVANGKGGRSFANPKGPNPYKRGDRNKEYIAGLFIGTLSIIPAPDKAEMPVYSRAVYKDTPFTKEKEAVASGEPGNPIPQKEGQSSPIKHVFYIIKENRTYDQVFGDIKEGNGDSALCLFGRKVTPNEHALAKDYVLFDNFYDDAEVSADGHNWSTAAYATDYVEKTWPTYYSGRGGTYDYEGSRKIAYPKDGFIWDYCARAGVSYRSYGEFVYHGMTDVKDLKGHIDKAYPGFDLNFMDIKREKIWEHDFDSLVDAHAVPRFQTIRLPNDHTYGARLGKRTPDAYAADNDLALGRLIQHLSHSKIWKSSAVFILEDDAQNGPDHVDAHRSIALVISPYVKRHYVDHTMYSTSSMLRTIELILGLPPMSQYDAAATPMWRAFTSKPNFTPYEALPNEVNLYAINTKNDEAARMSAKFDFAHADEAPDGPFNEVIWHAVKGEKSVMPAPRHSAFVKLVEKTQSDDDD